ncbi:hypothetical protein J2730_003865 [Chitinophaga ginsengisegetis]|nr:hypothetical protein [Chitinophaga ginsengisegetis]MDR6654944.1 hypothetical protein [Chitinophaga ginsengisegetis]
MVKIANRNRINFKKSLTDCKQNLKVSGADVVIN